MGGSSHDVCVFEWARNYTCGDKAGDVSHICVEVGVVLVGNLTHELVVVVARVSACTGDNKPGTEDFGVVTELLVVNEPSFFVQPVWHRFEEDGRCRNLRTMETGQNTTFRSAPNAVGH